MHELLHVTKTDRQPGREIRPDESKPYALPRAQYRADASGGRSSKVPREPTGAAVRRLRLLRFRSSLALGAG
jgi:hypothetical protein